MKLQVLAAVAVAAACVSVAQAEVVIDTVLVGNPGNSNDHAGVAHGGVDYVYDMGKYEVTAGQYTEFLNAVAAADTYGLYNTNMESSSFGCKIEHAGSSPNYSYSVAPDWANRPVNFVSWGDAVRFANWLHNGQPLGAQNVSTTEDGAYRLDGAMTDEELLAVVRKQEATWVIPSEDEWYKAAYHKNDGVMSNYFGYPTSSDSVPSNDLIDPDPGNNATFWDGDEATGNLGDYTIGAPYFRTEVGEHENSNSPYGTFDQGGNVWEWNETVIAGSYRVVRGESFYYVHDALNSAARQSLLPTYEGYEVGFRVAEIP